MIRSSKLNTLGEFKNGLNYAKHEVKIPIKIIGIPDFGKRTMPDYATLAEVDERIVPCDYYLNNGDILFVRSNGNNALVGRTMIIQDIKEKVGYSGFCIRFRLTDKDVNPYYLLYYLKSPMIRKQLSRTRQSNINNISQDSLGNLIIKLPQLSEQEKIAQVISNIDCRISLNNATNAELESAARTLYNYWFTQFDFPDANGKPYKSSGGAMVWNEKLRLQIPKGWKVKTLRQCVSSINTGLNPRQNFVLGQGENRYITIKNIINGQIDFSNCDFVDDEALRKIHNRSDISVGDILFTSIDPVGRLYWIRENPVDWDINESVFSIRTNTSVVTTEYLYSVMDSAMFRAKLIPLRTGSVQKGIRIGALEAIYLVMPESRTMEAFSAKVGSLYKKMGNANKQNIDLVALRDFLLPLLMNGQVRVDV